MTDDTAASAPARRGLSRRGLFGAAGAAVATGVAGYAAHSALSTAPSQAADTTGPVEFHGPHQAGITTPVQDRLHGVGCCGVPRRCRTPRCCTGSCETAGW